MHIDDIFAKDKTTFSFEFFPPKTPQAADELFDHIQQLQVLKPSFVSVTYGAGGATRQWTHDLVVKLGSTANITTVPHLTCVCHKRDDIQQILERYAQVGESGVSNILALRGDPPANVTNYDRKLDDFRHTADLVGFISEFNQKGIHSDKRGFGIGVAGFPEGHPDTPNRLDEMAYLKVKVDQGAHYIVTQLFFDNHDFYDFRERCLLAGISVPIIAGIMPISSISGMKRMAQLAGGARFPASLLRALQRAGDDTKAVERVGIQWASQQCQDLLDHQVQGIHFYTLNRSTATRQIYENLGVHDSESLR